MSSKLIKQPTSVTFAKYRYTVHEKRIMYAIVNSLQSKLIYVKKNKEKAKIELEEFCKNDYYVELHKKDVLPKNYQNYQVIKDSVNSLLKKVIEFPKFEKKETSVFTGLIQQAEMSKRGSTIKLKLSKDLLPILIFVANGYTKYALESAFNCNSSYTMRLYEFINQWRDQWKVNGFLIIKESVLRDFLCLGERYTKSNDVKKYILDKSSSELKEKADIWFSIKEPIKEGRKVVGWKIQIHKKKETKTQVKRLSRTTNEPKKPKKEPSLEEIASSKNKLVETLQKETKDEPTTYKRYTTKFNKNLTGSA